MLFFSGWPQWGGEGLAGLLPPDSLWRWCFYQPHAGRPFLLTNKSISHLNYCTLLQLLSNFVTCPLCDFDWLCARCACTNVFVKQILRVCYFWNPKDQWLCVFFLFLSFCVLLLVSEQAHYAPRQDPSPDQPGSSTEPFLWPWRWRHHTCSQGGGGTHRQKGLSVFFFHTSQLFVDTW